MNESRRWVVRGLALSTLGCATAKGGASGGKPKDVEVAPGEDLMQEHAALERILLLYEECARRVERDQPFDPEALSSAAGIVRRFIEDYHERQEEDFVFPIMRAAGMQVQLVDTLLKQHRQGRVLTDEILRRAAQKPDAALAQALRAFSRMYRPHAAREGSALIPSFRALVGDKAYRELGEKFEENEHRRFGERGFEHTVEGIARLEDALGLADLAAFSPV
jgi:hemerythrin-like domain-containing protein